MKKLLVIIGAMFVCTFAIAHSVEWYVDNKLVRTGLVENLEEDIEMLKEDGFEEVI